MISSTMQNAVHFYNQTFENADPRVSDWPMMQSPWPTLVICLSYVYVVKVLGPSLMRDSKPLDIRWLMIVYNFAMVIFNFLIFYSYGIYGWFGKYSYTCQPVDYSDNPDAIGMARTCWWFYLSKFIEFSDTIFFVMRKKYAQISTLHVTHHGIMPMSIWFGLKFTPGGHSTFFAFLNSFVHVLMYVYYGLAAIGPHMTKYLWWKKYMTGIQMVQFVMIFLHSFQLLFMNCNYPRGFMWWIGFHAVLFWFLFMDFYKNAYRNRRAKVSSGASNGSVKNEPQSDRRQQYGHHVEQNHQNGCPKSNGLFEHKIVSGTEYNHISTSDIHTNGIAKNGTHTYVLHSTNGHSKKCD